MKRKIIYATIIAILVSFALFNATITDFGIVNVQAESNVIENVTETIEVIVENITETVNLTSNETLEILNETSVENNTIETNFTNETNITKIVNVTLNEIIEENATVETNTTEIINEPSVKNLQVSLDYPDKITRGEPLLIKATVSNLGTVAAYNVSLFWTLPEGFLVVSDDDYCGLIEPNGSCTKELVLQTDVSTPMGLNKIKVMVNYD